MSGISADTGSVGGSDFASMLAILTNPAAMKKMYEDLEAKRKAAEAAVALVGPAKDIERLQTAAKKDRDDAAQILANATAQAKQLVEAATARAEGIVNEAGQKYSTQMGKVTAVQSEADTYLNKAKKMVVDADAAREAVAKRETAVEAKATDVENRNKVVTQREADVAAKVAALKSVRDATAAHFAEQLKKLG